ncbi:sigma-54-dependent Fis family transcriptional regulator [Burkholderia plantarii]|uniref:sigma-54-dependent Fis family transcriptional regulator n=1 Tax=Burkholderia plantarii TaxID=41899 RepID=UPI0005AEF4FC|nr:sigma-54-dependent Fis family transcriptional regulator [Burkholderia plantarii]
MPYAVARNRHAERVFGTLDGRLPAPADSNRLTSSWRRSLEDYRLDPGSSIGPRVLTASELREVREREDAFLRASGECLTRLHEMVRVADYCVMLTDAHGVTIDYRIDRERRAAFRQAGLHIGSCWSEREEGTCGVASVLTDLAPITVHKSDHFRAAFTTLTCSAAPIFAPGGELIGVLDASAVMSPDRHDSQRLVYQLVRQSAVLIEDGYFLNRTASHWVLFGHAGRDYVEARPDWLIAFDECGNIVAANRHAREALPELNAPRHLDEVFDMQGLPLRDAGRVEAITGLRVRATGALLHARVRAPLRRAARVPGGGSINGIGDSARRAGAARRPGALAPYLTSRDARVARQAELAARLAGKRLPILVLGETGAGKEVFARALHDAGPRRNRPFVAVNCGALPEALIESELFGHVAGAFTGARRHGARGRIAQADGGTLFLDEIGDMPLALQTRLLRVLADGEVMPLGGDAPVRVEFDLICATHRDLAGLVARQAFREDLYYRLGGAQFTLPPLRERADLDDLIRAVFAEEAQATGHVLTLDPALADALGRFAWPGNLRQLRHALRYACAVCDGTRVEPRHLPADLAAALAAPADDAGRGADDERARVVAALSAHRWRPEAAAAALGISRATLYRRIARLGIVPPHRR